MIEKKFHDSIRASWDLMHTQMGIGEAIINVRSLKVDQDFNAMALDKTSTYDSIYRAAISLSYYNIILEDQALFQFSWASKKSWRLAYLPNPWITGFASGIERQKEAEEMLQDGRLTEEGFNEFLSSLDISNSVPPIRYEYALDQHREVIHPAAHLHIGRHTENRWGVSRQLSPEAFCMMIDKQYYSESWNALSNFSNSGLKSCIDNEFINVLSKCYSVPNIPLNEKKILHFTSS